MVRAPAEHVRAPRSTGHAALRRTPELLPRRLVAEEHLHALEYDAQASRGRRQVSGRAAQPCHHFARFVQTDFVVAAYKAPHEQCRLDNADTGHSVEAQEWRIRLHQHWQAGRMVTWAIWLCHPLERSHHLLWRKRRCQKVTRAESQRFDRVRKAIEPGNNNDVPPQLARKERHKPARPPKAARRDERDVARMGDT